jgi:hypothetical protein
MAFDEVLAARVRDHFDDVGKLDDDVRSVSHHPTSTG